MTDWEKQQLKHNIKKAISALDDKYEMDGKDWNDIEYFINQLFKELPG